MDLVEQRACDAAEHDKLFAGELVIRNTFFELVDDQPALGLPEGEKRARAHTDGHLMTESKIEPYQVELGGHQVGCSPSGGAALVDAYGNAVTAMSEVQWPAQYPAAHVVAPWGYVATAAVAAGTVPAYVVFPDAWGYAGFGGEMANAAGGLNPSGPEGQATPSLSGGGATASTRGRKGGKNSPQVGPSAAPGTRSKSGTEAWIFGRVEPSPPGKSEATAAQSAAPVAAVSGADYSRTPGGGIAGPSHTTVMLRNIPNRYTQSMLIKLLGEQDFSKKYDFVYLPMDFRNGVNLGYAFVNLLSHKDAVRFMTTFDGFADWFLESSKVCEVSWAHPHQGYSEHVERYRNSPVMHSSMPDEYKPMVFKDGNRIDFPAPTKVVRAPKLRPVREGRGREGSGADAAAPGQ